MDELLINDSDDRNHKKSDRTQKQDRTYLQAELQINYSRPAFTGNAPGFTLIDTD